MKRHVWYLVSVPLCVFLLLTKAAAEELSVDSYTENKDKKGVILIGVNWGRQWNCGTYENAELRNLEFELFPAKDSGNNENQRILLEGPMRLFSKPMFIDYGFLVDPGTYALTRFKVKVAASVRDVGHFEATRKDLINDGVPRGGTFNVEAGEIVYIGHFFLGCDSEPIPWRYYPDGKEAFNDYLGKVAEKFPFLNKDAVKFRLFKTSTFGVEYELK